MNNQQQVTGAPTDEAANRRHQQQEVVGKISFNRSEVLGRGRFSKCFRGMYEGLVDVAVKRFEKSETKIDFEVLRKTDRHPNVARFYGAEDTDVEFDYIASELCAGSLHTLLQGLYTGPPVGDGREILRQIMYGVEYLHSMKIFHGNLNPNNILISFPMGRIGPKMKVSGFGQWKIIPATPNVLFRVHGHEDWTPVEAKTQYRPTVQVDIFSLGCIFAYTLSGGRHPYGDNCFSNSIKQKIAFRIEMSRQPTHLTGKEVKEPEALNLIRAMLSAEPMQRPAALVVLNDPFFSN